MQTGPIKNRKELTLAFVLDLKTQIIVSANLDISLSLIYVPSRRLADPSLDTMNRKNLHLVIKEHHFLHKNNFFLSQNLQ